MMKETNMEHYRGEIEAILNKEEVIAISKLDGSIFACNEDECDQCICCNGRDEELIPCDVTLMRWLMSEYKPEPVLTEREKHFVEFALEGWLVRERGGGLYQHREKPYKKDEREWSSAEGFFNMSYFGANALFPFITWEDEEPWSVESLRKLKVEE